MKIGIIIQARMGSTRLPGKVLSEIVGKPLIEHVVLRVKKSKYADQIIVAITNKKQDDRLVEFLKLLDVSIFRGSEEDVLDRYYQAAKKYHLDIIVRVTGDCPLIDLTVVDNTIQYFLHNDYDYVSNTVKETFPDGLDVEVFSFECLEQSYNTAHLPSEREHVTPFTRNHPEKFKIGNFKNNVDLSNLRWTVDEMDDLEFDRAIYRELYHLNPFFDMQDVLNILKKHPELEKINAGIKRNEGYLISLQKDKNMEE